MKDRFSLALLVAMALAPGVLAAHGSGVVQEPARNATAERTTRPAPPEPTVNVQIEVAITDSIGSGAPQRKTVTILLADGNMGRVRAQRGNAVLNVDATPRLHRDGRVAVQFSLEYRPRETAETLDSMSPINEFLTVLLQSGKPLVVTQAADPTSERKVAVELTATVLK